jgi:mRNA interferase MazF
MATSRAKRGEIWLVDLDPTRGSEIQKLRPAVVMSADAIASVELRIIVPITGYKPRHDRYPWCIPLKPNPRNGLSKKSTADVFQIKCASIQRFGKRIGVLSASTVEEIAEAVAICIDLGSE